MDNETLELLHIGKDVLERLEKANHALGKMATINPSNAGRLIKKQKGVHILTEQFKEYLEGNVDGHGLVALAQEVREMDGTDREACEVVASYFTGYEEFLLSYQQMAAERHRKAGNA